MHRARQPGNCSTFCEDSLCTGGLKRLLLHEMGLYVAVPQLRRSVAGFPQWRPGFEPRSGHVGFMIDKIALGQVFSEVLRLPLPFSFHRLLQFHHLSSGAGTIGQLVADVPNGLKSHPTPRN
jgi:hypothetical protein